MSNLLARAIFLTIYCRGWENKEAFAATGLTDNILLTPQTPEPEKPVFNPYKGRLELPDARSSNSQRFLNLEDGSITEEISLVPTFFRNGKGDWVPIETEIMPTYAEGFKFKNKANSFDILFGDNALVRFGKKTNWIVSKQNYLCFCLRRSIFSIQFTA